MNKIYKLKITVTGKCKGERKARYITITERADLTFTLLSKESLDRVAGAMAKARIATVLRVVDV